MLKLGGFTSALLVVLMLLPLTAPLLGPETLSLRVRPLVMNAPEDIRIEVRVTPDKRNRLLALSWTSDTGTTGASQRQLDGENEAVLHTWTLRDQPPSLYFFTVAVYDGSGKLLQRADAKILAPNAPRVH